MELLKADCCRGELSKQSSALGRKKARERREEKIGREREKEKALESSNHEGRDTAGVGGTLRESRLLTQS
jgi:hypothetical protein